MRESIFVKLSTHAKRCLYFKVVTIRRSCHNLNLSCKDIFTVHRQDKRWSSHNQVQSSILSRYCHCAQTWKPYMLILSQPSCHVPRHDNLKQEYSHNPVLACQDIAIVPGQENLNNWSSYNPVLVCQDSTTVPGQDKPKSWSCQNPDLYCQDIATVAGQDTLKHWSCYNRIISYLDLPLYPDKMIKDADLLLDQFYLAKILLNTVPRQNNWVLTTT